MEDLLKLADKSYRSRLIVGTGKYKDFAHKMNDFKRVAPFEQRQSVGFAGNDVAIELDDDAAGTDLQLFKQLGDAQPIGNLFFFSVEINLHQNAKTAFTRATTWWPGNTVLSSSRAKFQTMPLAGPRLSRFPTPVRPGSGSKGYLLCQALSLPQADTPSILMHP